MDDYGVTNFSVHSMYTGFTSNNHNDIYDMTSNLEQVSLYEIELLNN